jgi:hypothetical protein
MAAITTTASPVRSVARSGRHRRLPSLTGTGARLLAGLRHFCEGESWEPGGDWLTRVTDPGERQEPR